jgi:hypothetical protein
MNAPNVTYLRHAAPRDAAKKAEDLLGVWKRMHAKRSGWDDYWQELGDVLLPNKADFTAGHAPADRRSRRIYDSAPRQAARSLVTTVDGLVKPKTARWFWMTLTDKDLAELDEVKRWLDDCTERMRAAIYAPSARFVQRSGEVDESLVVFGTGAMFTGMNRQKNGLMFKSYHLSRIAFDEDEDGVANRAGIVEMLKPYEAARKFGEANLHPDRVKQMHDNLACDIEHAYVQIVLPNDDYEAGRIDHRGKQFAAVWLDIEKTHLLEEGGFEEFPFQLPRWDTSPTEIYGRSPGMMALPDSKTLQAMGKTLLVAGQKSVDPPTWSWNDGSHSAIRTRPGSHISFSAAMVGQLGARDPIGVLEMGKNMPIGLDMQVVMRQQVEAAFFKNVFSLPVQGRAMTATEILERKEEFLRTIGPVFGRLETDYIGALIERVFNVMSRIPGAFAPFPDVGDRDVKISFEYLSPIQQARKAVEMASFGRTIEMFAPVMAASPEAAEKITDNFDFDVITRDLPEAGAFPQKWLKPKEIVEAEREQRAKQKEAAFAAEAAKSAGPLGAGVKSIAEADALSGGDIGAALSQVGAMPGGAAGAAA